MAKRTGLGRGLDALFETSDMDREEKGPSNDGEHPEDGIKRVDINNIKPNANQPRKIFDSEKINELANSIKEHGIIQPIVIRKNGHGFEIVAGERRWRAARVAGLKEIPCVVRDLTDEQNVLFAIIENMQREDLNPIEEAEGLDKMISNFGLTQDEVSKTVGKSRPYITNSLRLLKLDEEIKYKISSGKITAGHGRALIGLSDLALQKEIVKKIEDQGLSVRAVEELVNDRKEKKKAKPAKRKAKSADLLLVERELKSTLGTKVNINSKGKKGKIEIEYYSNDDLERIIEILKKTISQ